MNRLDINRVSDISRHKRVKSKFFDWDTEFAEFAFICLNHVRVGFSNLLKLSLDLFNGFILKVLYFFEGALNYT